MICIMKKDGNKRMSELKKTKLTADCVEGDDVNIH